MQEPKSIAVETQLKPSCDFAYLKSEGIDFTQVLSGDIWTDYNEHDPGVTILEQICFALTESAYKANLNIEDLLLLNNTFGNQSQNDLLFFAPQDILPSNPVTVNDYRRLLIDHFFPKLKNAWVIPTEGEKASGLYTVYIFLAEYEKEQADFIKEVKQFLATHRNLGEDFEEIVVLAPHPVRIEVSIDLEYDIVPEEALAEIQFYIEQTIAPAVLMESFEDAIANGLAIEDILKGPLLKYGYIAEEELEATDLKYFNKLYAIEIMRAISLAEGVDNTYDFAFISGDTPDVLAILPYHYPVLDFSRCAFNISVNDLPYEPDMEKVNYFHTVLKSSNQFIPTITDYQLFKTTFKAQFTKKDITNYHSIQHSFPKTYGISIYGLPPYATPADKGRARQLKGYLIFFDQMMTNYLAMLSNVRTLFSVDSIKITEAYQKTYFYNIPKNIPDFEALVDAANFEQVLEKLNTKYDDYLGRKNRFLNHLLARFGETPLLTNLSRFENNEKAVIESKLAYLYHLPKLAMNKAKGQDYHQEESVDNVTALKRKLYFLFSIKEQYNTVLLAAIENTASLMTLKNKASKNNTAIKFGLKGKNIREKIFLHGANINNYTIEKKQKEYHVAFSMPSAAEAVSIYNNQDYQSCKTKLTKLINRLNDINQLSEGFHLIEHILLRPVESISFKYHLLARNTQVLSSTALFKTDKRKEKKSFVEQLKKVGIKKANYTVEEKNAKSFDLILKAEKETIAITEGFPSRKEAQAAISPIIKLLESKTITQLLNINSLMAAENLEPWHNTTFDKFEQQISFILPAWPARFQNLNFRRLFQNTAMKEMPPHLLANFYWLSIEEMKGLEPILLEWQALKRQASKGIDTLSFKIVEMLETFEQQD